MSQHGIGGTLYRVGEHVLVTDDAGELSLAKIDAILVVNIEEEYHLLLKGEEYAQSVTETLVTPEFTQAVKIHLLSPLHL